MVVTGDAPVAPVANEACGIEVELGVSVMVGPPAIFLADPG